jgi:hypothetical protein
LRQTISAYSITSLVVLVTGGVVTFPEAPSVGANLPTPWIGVWQRINLGVFLLWVVVLAMALLRTRNTDAMIGRPEALAA